MNQKWITILLTLTMALFVMTGCGSSDTPANADTNQTDNSQAVSEVEETTEPEEAVEPAYTYKEASQEASHWRAYSKEEFAAEEVADKTIAYQFVGQDSGDRDVDLLINLYDDGFVRMKQYSDGALSFNYNGYWRNKDNESIYFAVLNYVFEGADNPDYGVYNGEIATVDYSYDLTQIDGKFTFGANYCLGFGDGGVYARSVMLEGDGSVQYETVSDYESAIGVGSSDQAASDNSADDTATDDTLGAVSGSLVLDFTPDTSDQLKTVFTSDAATWQGALGSSGAYTASDSDEVLLSWSNETDTFTLDLLANGTYLYQFTSMQISETGTWEYAEGILTLTTENGNVFIAQEAE